MTFLLVTKNTSPETMESLIIVSNSLVQTGHIVYIKFNDYQSFSGILFDNIIEISAPVRQLGRPINPIQSQASQQFSPNPNYLRPNTQFTPQYQQQFSQSQQPMVYNQQFRQQPPTSQQQFAQPQFNMQQAKPQPANFLPQAPNNFQNDLASKPIPQNVNNSSQFKPF